MSECFLVESASVVGIVVDAAVDAAAVGIDDVDVDLDGGPTIPNVEHDPLAPPILEDLPRPFLPRWDSVVLW